ncbi:MAG: substrate-binding domain-containing protein [Planctomycetota bacterium]
MTQGATDLPLADPMDGSGRDLRRIAVVIDHEPLMAMSQQVLRGLINYVHDHGCRWRTALFQPMADVRSLRDWQPDGLLLCHHRQAWQREPLPAVYVGVEEVLSHITRVEIDQAHLARLAAMHLLERRFRRFACVGTRGKIWSQVRSDAFLSRLTEEGLPSPLLEVDQCEKPHSDPYSVPEIARWIAKLGPATAVFATNELLSLAVLKACWLSGRTVPQEIAVLGVDDYGLECELSDPPLSSVENPLQTMGRRGAELLSRLMNADPDVPRRVVVKSAGVHVRQSTDITAVDDPIVADAIAYLRTRFDTPGGVEQVADALNVSRSTLHRRFVQALGHGPLHEIHRLKMQRAEELLIVSDQSIESIAQNCGFTHATHMTRLFRKMHGTTPGAYRRKNRLG